MSFASLSFGPLRDLVVFHLILDRASAPAKMVLVDVDDLNASFCLRDRDRGARLRGLVEGDGAFVVAMDKLT